MAGRPGKIERIERAQPVGPEKYVSRFYLMKAYASSDPLPRGYRKQRFPVFILFQQLINMRELILGKVYNPLLELFVHFSFDPRKVFPLFAYAGFGPGKADLQWKIQ